MYSNVVIVKIVRWTKQCVWSSVSHPSQACICYVFFFQLYLKTAISTSTFRSFYLQFILCILAIGRNRSSRAEKKKKKSKAKHSCTFKAAGLSISSRSGSQMVTWLMDWSTVVVWITSSDKFCSKPERPGLTRTLRMPGAPCVLSRSWAANGWICKKQYIRK